MEALTEIFDDSQLSKVQHRIKDNWKLGQPRNFKDIIVPMKAEGDLTIKKMRSSARNRVKYTTKENFKNLLVENFTTKDEELDYFKQNDEKVLSDD